VTADFIPSHFGYGGGGVRSDRPAGACFFGEHVQRRADRSTAMAVISRIALMSRKTIIESGTSSWNLSTGGAAGFSGGLQMLLPVLGCFHPPVAR